MGGRCTTHTDGLMSVTKADCCCTMGAAWGPHCEVCPSPSSDDYQDLCLESGYSVDGNGKYFSSPSYAKAENIK
jgi:TB domain.